MRCLVLSRLAGKGHQTNFERNVAVKVQSLLAVSAFALSACGGSSALVPANPGPDAPIDAAQALVDQALNEGAFFEDLTEALPASGNAVYSGALVLADAEETGFALVGAADVNVDFNSASMSGSADEFYTAVIDDEGTITNLGDETLSAVLVYGGDFDDTIDGGFGTLELLGTIDTATVEGEVLTAFSGADADILEGVGSGDIDGEAATIFLRTER